MKGLSATLALWLYFAVCANVSVFDLIIGRETAYHDVSDDILTEFHPWLKSIWFQANDALLKLARKTAEQQKIPFHIGKIVTGESFISDKEKHLIADKYTPLAVDMETAAIAHVCHVNNIPFIAIRAVSDSADHVEFDTNCRRACTIAA